MNFNPTNVFITSWARLEGRSGYAVALPFRDRPSG